VNVLSEVWLSCPSTPTSDRSSATTSDAAASPGKRTLVEQAYATAAPAAPVQREASPAAGAAEGPAGLDPERVHQAAQHGTSGSGGSLPHLDRIQRSFGRHDVSGVRAHTTSARRRGARAMGAEAFADGEQVAFGGAPASTLRRTRQRTWSSSAGRPAEGGRRRGGRPLRAARQRGCRSRRAGAARRVAARPVRRPGRRARGSIQRLDTSFGKFDTTKYDKVGPVAASAGSRSTSPSTPTSRRSTR